MNRTALIPLLSAIALAVPVLVFADDSFIPLTSIPGITSLTGSPTLPSFLNNLYRISIGVAAFAAVARFIYAGYLIMTDSGSVTKNKKAREMIQNTVIGLVLVLSPAVVFGIINPKILDLSLDFTKLQSNNGTDSGSTATTSSTLETQNAKQCTAFSSLSLISKGGACSDSGEGWTSAPATCCEAGDASFQCCGKPK